MIMRTSGWRHFAMGIRDIAMRRVHHGNLAKKGRVLLHGLDAQASHASLNIPRCNGRHAIGLCREDLTLQEKSCAARQSSCGVCSLCRNAIAETEKRFRRSFKQATRRPATQLPIPKTRSVHCADDMHGFVSGDLIARWNRACIGYGLEFISKKPFGPCGFEDLA